MVIFVLLLVFGCEKSQNNDRVHEEIVTLEFSDTLILEIDSVTKRNSKHIGFIEKLNSLYLFNDVTYQVYFFDLSSGRSWKKVALQKEGPLGIGQVSKIRVADPDSIVVFNRHSNRLFFVGEEGRYIERHQVFSFNEPDPSIQTFSPYVQYEPLQNRVFLPIRANSRTSEERSRTLMVYDLKTKEKKFLKDWPEEYYRWGALGSESAGLFHAERDTYIFSYSFDPYLYELNLRTEEINKHYAGSQLVSQPDMFESKGQGLIDRLNYDLGNSWYRNLHFDKYNRVYFRSASIGRDLPYDEANAMANFRKYNSLNGDEVFAVTVILNDRFEIIGEYRGMMIGNNAFSSENGLFVKDPTFDPENEDIIAFARYELKPKE